MIDRLFFVFDLEILAWTQKYEMTFDCMAFDNGTEICCL